MAEQSLKNKTVKGVAWSGIDNVVQFGVTFVVSIVLARLLTPDDYGLIGIITIFTTVSAALVDGGLTTALIRKKEITNDDFNTSFLANLSMSIVLYICIFVSAPLIAEFFRREELVSLTRVCSLGIIIDALAIVQRVRLTKRLDFKSQAKITLIASVLSGIIGIGLAFLCFGVWALVAQSLAVHSLRAMFLCFYNKWMPHLRFSQNSFNELFGFGWKMMLSRLLDTVWKELYQVVVGRFYNPATLGQYTRAKQFSYLFSTNITNVIQRVTYPVLADIQDDRERMVTAYRMVIKTTMFVTANGMLLLAGISEPLVYCLIGSKWHEASVYLPLICISGSTYPLHAINLNMLQVQGRSDLYLGLEILKKVIAVGPLLIGAFVGIMPMLMVNIITIVIYYFLNSYYSGELIGYSSLKQLRDIAPSYQLATILGLSVFFLKYIPISYWVILPMQIILGCLVFFTLSPIICRDEYKETKTIVTPFLKKINSLWLTH